MSSKCVFTLEKIFLAFCALRRGRKAKFCGENTVVERAKVGPVLRARKTKGGGRFVAGELSRSDVGA